MVDAGEEVGFDFLAEIAELELHAGVPNMPAADLLLKGTPVKLQIHKIGLNKWNHQISCP